MKLSAQLAAAALALAGFVATPSAQVVWQDVIRNLRHPDPAVRLESVQQLGRATYVAAADAVAQLIGDADDRVQQAAIETQMLFFLVDKFEDTQAAFEAGPLVRGALPAPPVVIDRLIGAMRDENVRIRFDAVHALGAIAEAPIQPSQIEALADQLEHYDPIMRAATCRVFARLRVAEVAPQLVVALGDSSPIVREYAVDALGRIRAEAAVPHLLSMIIRERERDSLAPLALLALARVAPASALDQFRKRLADKNVLMRRAAVEGLGRLRDKDSIDAIRQMAAKDKSSSVRLAAQFALNALGEVQTHTIASAMVLRDIGGDARDYLLEIGRPAVPGIESALKVAKDARHRADLVQLVGFIGGREDVTVVRPFLQDRNKRVAYVTDNTIVRLNQRQ